MAERLVHQPAERDRLTLARTLGVSPRRLLGWEPEERHEHYDAEGNLTGYTVVTRESEWGDDDRTRLLALAQYENGLHVCGFHWSLLEDPTNVFMPEHRVCPVCRGSERYERIQGKADEAAMKHAEDNPGAPRPTDGRSLYMRILSPHEAEEIRARRSVAQQAPRK